MGIRTSAVISEMDSPLGRMVGNAMEVAEAVQCLRGQGPRDLEELVIKQGGLLLASSGNTEVAVETGEELIKAALGSGKALSKVQF